MLASNGADIDRVGLYQSKHFTSSEEITVSTFSS